MRVVARLLLSYHPFQIAHLRYETSITDACLLSYARFARRAVLHSMLFCCLLFTLQRYTPRAFLL